LKLINAPSGLAFPQGYNDFTGRKTTDEQVAKYLSQVASVKLYQLYLVYRNDYELFGYNFSMKDV